MSATTQTKLFHPHLLSLVLSLGIKLYHSPTPSTRIPFSTLTFVSDVGVGITVVPFILIATSLRLYRGLEKREKKKIKQKFFKKNGGLLLQQQISSSKESVEKTKLYSVEELEKATDGFNLSRIIGKGGLGTVYKGMLSDGSIVAIKKSNTVDEKQLDQFINEVLILSQINHRHIVKLLGCCLETEKSMIQEDFSQQQTCQDDCTVSERSHSYTFGPATEEIVQDIEVLLTNFFKVIELKEKHKHQGELKIIVFRTKNYQLDLMTNLLGTHSPQFIARLGMKSLKDI
ncbi:unnamed protein product, partial [Vitis vinifera]|uniref:Protein kinase domain-containing protein n=1 Tax=Vitis vinifera TaxID=29760 RepID=D7TKM1_VITVI